MEEPKLCFVMMPSGNHGEYEGGKEESDFILKGIIEQALKQSLGANIKIIREIDNRKPGAINNEIIRKIALADICIVDITGQNPNVFLELGVRYALRRSTTILLRQSQTIIPFDIFNYRSVEYSSKFSGPAKAVQEIISTVNHVFSQNPRPTDSLVFEIFPKLLVEIPGVMRESDEAISSVTTMSWSEYWERLQKVIDKMRDNFSDGRYVPHAILGISNGGLMYADLLGRELFKGVPILSLWANRIDSESKYFENQINDSVIKGIEDYTSNVKGKIEVLLVDDIIASGTTLQQAVLYLRNRLPSANILFLPLFSRNEKYFDLIKENIIWLSPIFHFDEKEAIDMHTVEKNILPYKKEIRST